MSDNPGSPWNRDSLLENFAAEVNSAAYAVALRHGVQYTPDCNASVRSSHGHAD
jgi:hypothetical protein